MNVSGDVQTDWLRDGDLLAHRYRLLERTGAGGMSVIWRARDEALERVVAVKVLDSELASDRVHRELVRKEARAAARLSHPDATAVYDYGETLTPDRRLVAYVVMQLVDGQPLAIRLASGPLPWREAVRVAIRVARVLAAAHARGIVHRDITPDNVMLTPDGAKVLDFGIAARIGEPDDDATGWTFGTPPYVAPERLDGTPAQTPTDIYSLGALLFEMLTGRPPYPETTWDEIEAAHRTDPPPLPVGVPGLPPAVAKVCQRCLSAVPAARPSAADVAEDLADALAAASRRRRAHALTPRWAGATVAATASAVVAVTIGMFGGDLLDGARPLEPGQVVRAAPGPEPSATTGPGLPVPAPTPTVAPGETIAQPPLIVPTAPPTTQQPPVVVPTQAPPPSSDQAFAAAHAVIDRGMASGEVRTDAALDFHQVLDNLAVEVASGSPEVPVQMDNLHRKVDDRRREGAISLAVATELNAALLTLDSTLTRG